MPSDTMSFISFETVEGSLSMIEAIFLNEEPCSIHKIQFQYD